jgi:hypothetical protein
MLKISVAICTHNPRADFLTRALAGLKTQTLPMGDWEFLIIDNASREPLSASWDLSWHPRAKVIREEKLGLTPARLRAISEARSQLLVFVDDDNVPAEDYLEQALRLGGEWPMLGAWGGSIVPSFEVEPPAWAGPYLRYLALREVREDKWSNLTDNPGLMPWGAGMCVRREVALEYARRLAADPVRLALDRRGQALPSCGDSDFAMTACDMGLGTGLFRALRLTHLIPAGRLQEAYLLRLMQGMAYSLAILQALRGPPPGWPSWARRLWGHLSALRRGPREFRFHRASQRGLRAALKEVASWEDQRPPLEPRSANRPTEGAFRA